MTVFYVLNLLTSLVFSVALCNVFFLSWRDERCGVLRVPLTGKDKQEIKKKDKEGDGGGGGGGEGNIDQ